MKRFILAAIGLFFALGAHAQVSVQAGLSSEFSPSTSYNWAAIQTFGGGINAASINGIGLGSAVGQGAITPISGGSGYVIGDTVTVGCAGTTWTTNPIIVVNNVLSGVITGSTVTITGVSASTSVPSCTLTQVSTSGTGTGASWTGKFGPIAGNVSYASLNTGGGNSNGNLIIGAETPNAALYGAENSLGGDRTGSALTGGSTANSAWGHGSCGNAAAGVPLFVGSFNSCFGDDAGRNMAGSSNSLYGQNTGRVINSNNSSMFGAGAGSAATFCNSCSLFGFQVGSINLVVGARVILIGTSSAVDVPASGTNDYLNIDNIFKTTGTGTPATSISTVSGQLNVAGTMQFGTLTGTVCVNSGFITVNDNGGTSRKLMVCS